MTKTELLQIRDSTYRPPALPEKRCETCVYKCGSVWCRVAADATKSRVLAVCDFRSVHPLGVCDLWAGKEVAK